jgi:alpha-1,6-mannosyltransferase
MKSLSSSLAWTGAAYLAAVLTIVITRTPLGSPLFLGSALVAAAAYAVMLGRVWREDRAPRSLLLAAFALAVAFRVPMMIPKVGADSDMVRYVWDGRVQLLGYNPYQVRPSDPAVAATHTDETRHMPSARAQTPYPPGAQLFFRLVVALRDSSRAMKLALVACDLLTIVVLWRWLVVTGRSEWLALAYAWNPLVVFEVAHSGHIDALGALWIAASAYWLARRRTALASIAFVLAVTTKLLPIVLVPLYWRRIRIRDAVAGAILFALLYLPFISGPTLPFGAVPNVVAHIRFNGPVFKWVAALAGPQMAAIAAVGVGLAIAAWARWRLGASDPAAWAWPMAAALVCAPVIYPWYLLYFTPFLFTTATLPLAAWTLSIIPTYIVWDMARHGGLWAVPAGLMVAEYGLPCALAACALVLRWRRRPAEHLSAVSRPLSAKTATEATDHLPT